MSSIHPTAVISDKAEIAEGVIIGPYCVIGDNVKIGAGSELKSHVVIDGYTTIGERNLFFPFAAIGQLTQDLKYDGEPTSLVIGDDNTFRENCTIHRSTDKNIPTRIGNHNLFLCYSHVAHDCQVGNHVIMSNNGTLAGHVTVDDHAIISGFAAVHQFCRVGKHAMIGGCCKVVQDVPPYCIVDGNPSETRGINQIGLQRRGFSDESIRDLKVAYRKTLFKKKQNLGELVHSFEEVREDENAEVTHLLDFIKTSQRGIIR